MTDLAKPRERETWLAGLMRDRLGALLQTEAARQRFSAVTLAAIARDRNLMRCDKTSLALSLLTCAELGLEPNGALDLAYLVPRKGSCSVQLGYKGLTLLAHRANPGATISAAVVYSCDQFLIRAGTDNPGIEHIPDLTGSRSDSDIVAAYAVIRLSDGGLAFEWCDRAEIDKRRKAGGGNSPAWRNHFAAMARKTALRKLLLGGTVPLAPSLAAPLVEALKAEDKAGAPVVSGSVVDALLGDDETPAEGPFVVEGQTTSD